MQSLDRILVCLDPDREEQPALAKAIYLAKEFDSHIELFLAVYNRGLVSNLFFSSEEFEAAKQGFINSQKRWLTTYQEEVAKEGIGCDIDIVWHKPLYEAVIQKAKESKAQLVIKSTHHHPTINKVFFTPNDWQLLKACPVPLILAKKETGPAYSNIFAAIDPSHHHDKPEQLDSHIVSNAVSLSNKLGGKVKVGHCYDPIGYQLWSDIGFGMGVGMGPTDFTMGEENYEAYVEQLHKTQKEAFDKIVAPFSLPDGDKVLEEGYPETLLPEMVERFDIDLLVLGNVYHSGLVGSTSEKILDQVNCDVLSINMEKHD
ncbi:universal stress protein [Aliikangiella sp. G2MR2-5]|uniref:universal stress protein n=1 Tax=Aliikangiella sp. G2MR2-5 TaxID=2788943 RepID=UPI0018AC2971|nr:universal stress protein [Aliikangiella sp. G2MR2-5]